MTWYIYGFLFIFNNKMIAGTMRIRMPVWLLILDLTALSALDSLCTFSRQTKALRQILMFTHAAISNPVY